MSGWLGIAVVYALERQALRLASARTVSVLLSLEPAAAALVLGQRLAPQMTAGMACVLAAATVITARLPAETQPARRARRSPAR